MVLLIAPGVGSLIGGGIGSAIGAISGFMGGKKITKGINSLGKKEPVKGAIKGAGIGSLFPVFGAPLTGAAIGGTANLIADFITGNKETKGIKSVGKTQGI